MISFTGYSQSWLNIGTPANQRLISGGDTTYRSSQGSYGYIYFKSLAAMKSIISDSLSNGYVQVNKASDGTIDYFKPTANTDAARGVALQAAFAAATTGDNINIGAGSYLTTSRLTVKSGQKVVLMGSEIYHTSDTLTTFYANNISNAYIGGYGTLRGSGAANGTVKLESGIKIEGKSAYNQLIIENLKFLNFRGAAIRLLNTHTLTSDTTRFQGNSISNCEFKHTRVGVYNAADYTKIVNCSGAFNETGVNSGIGNLNIIGGSWSKNDWALKIDNSVGNPGHGSVTGVQINHNNLGGVKVSNINLGMSFNNCIFAGIYPYAHTDTTIYIESSRGINFTGGELLEPVQIYLAGTMTGYSFIRGAYINAPTTTSIELHGTDLQKSYLRFEQNTTLDTLGFYLNKGISVPHGGTGKKSFTPYALVTGGSTVTDTLLQVSSVGTSGQVLTSNGASSVPSWGSAPEVTLTFSTGLTRTVNTVTNNLSTGISGGQSAYGGVLSSETLTLKNYPSSATSFVIDNNRIIGTATTATLGGLFKAAAVYGVPINGAVDFRSESSLTNSSTTSQRFNGGSFAPSIAATNTGNYTATSSGGALVGATFQPSIASGATGTITGMSNIFTSMNNAAAGATLTNAVGVMIGPFSGNMTNIANLQTGLNSFVSGNWNFYCSSAYNNYLGTGNTGFGTTSPSAVINIKGGTATASTAPLKFTSGTNLTTAEAGAVEYDGTNLYFTPASARKTFAFLDSPTFTGTPAAPTATAGTNTTQIATTAFVQSALGSASIQNQNAGAQTSSNFWISGEGRLSTLKFDANNYLEAGLIKSTSQMGFHVDGTQYLELYPTGNSMVGSLKIGSTIGIGDTKSVLDLQSTTKGILTPRMTTTQRDAITSPPEGLEVYNLTTNSKNYYNGTIWKESLSNISGSFSGVGAVTTTFTVTIGQTMANTTYKVNATPSNVLSAAVFYINNKTTTAFDVVYLAGLTGTVAFDWSVFP